jgi:hypothetical protein
VVGRLGAPSTLRFFLPLRFFFLSWYLTLFSSATCWGVRVFFQWANTGTYSSTAAMWRASRDARSEGARAA